MEQPENLEQVVTATGTYWLPTDAPDDVIIQTMKQNHVFEVQVFNPVFDRLSGDKIVIDVGPCYGQMSVLFSKRAKRVIAIEASAKMHRICEKNILYNRVDNVTLINAAAWDKSGELKRFMDYDFSHYKSYGCFGIDPAGNGRVEVTTIAIDDLELSGDQIAAIKIDAQGADLHVMRGAEKTIRQHRCSVHFEYEPQYDDIFHVNWREYEEFIEKIGYRITERINEFNYVIESKD